MKKLFNKKFIFILGSSITFLVVLTVAMIFLTKERVLHFSESGYIIASGKEDSTKYYFDEGTNYKTNINKELVFEDTSGEKVKVETNNFLHYIDGGIKFLKNGVIMDLDSSNLTIVPYYNITNKSVLEYSKKSYYIETVDKTLAFNNIIGRISDNKYIVAGIDVSLQLAGNDNVITGDYFEITFIEDGIIKVENQEISYQATAENSYILSGENVKIDLGLKRIYYDDEEKISLEQLTIDGNENIEIIPLEPDGENKDDQDDNQNGTGQGGNDGSNGTGTGDGTGTGNNTGDGSGQGGTGTGDGTGSSDGDNTGDGSTGTGQGGSGTGGSGNSGSGNRKERTASIEIIEAEVGVNNISAKFHISDPDNTIKGDLVLHITNSDTGKRVYTSVIDKSKNEVGVSMSTLSPDSNYILSINEENNEKYDTQYFQKLFRTDELGISLDKKYVTSDSVAYVVNFEEDTKVKSVRVNLYDENYKEVTTPITVDKTNSIVIFNELKNNTSYNVVLDNVILDNLEYNDTYQIYKSVITLKNTPYLSGLSSQTDEESNTFTIGLDNVVDTDSSITKYSYYIYKADDITLDNMSKLKPVKVIEKNDASKVKVEIDNKTILPKTDYKFKVIAEYYDNEKYGEYETEFSNNFILAGKPFVSFAVDTNNTTFNKLVGTLTIKDENCTVPMSGRGCSTLVNYDNDFRIEYQVVNSLEKKIIDNVRFDPETLQLYNNEQHKLEVEGLIANTEYIFNVYGDVDLRDGKEIREGYLIGTFRADTSGVEVLTVDTWNLNDSTIEDLINVSTRIVSANNNEELAESLNNLTFNLYAGNVKFDLEKGAILTPIATRNETGYLKDKYYNKLFTINTLDTFNFKDAEIETEEGFKVARAIDFLKEKTNNQLEKTYTIQITNASDKNGNPILIENGIFTFDTPTMIRVEENEINPTITPTPITNEMLGATNELGELIYEKEKDENLFNDTIVGYKVDVQVNPTILEKYFDNVNELIYYVCDADINADCTIDTAVETRTINLNETDITETIFYLENGTTYETVDEVLTRGHNYIFRAKFKVNYVNNDFSYEALYPSKVMETEVKETLKQNPTYSIYIHKTTGSEVIYKYSFNDVDNALFDNKFYYVVDSLEAQTFNFSEEDFKISNLANDSYYNISFKQARIKNEASIEDVLVGEYLFDGKYVYSSDTINFENLTYENDNRLRILILENEFNKKFADRISAYQVTLSAEGTDDYTRVYPTNSEKITTCNKNDTEYKCIIVDYALIKNFKAKDVNVNVTAYYDSGIIDNDFENLSTSENGYILQNNNIYNPDKIRANYIDFVPGVTTSPVPYGLYEYVGNTKDKIQIVRKIDLNTYTFSTSNNSFIQPELTYSNDSILIKDSTEEGYQSINNKVIEKVSLGSSNSNFRFNSYIPKIGVSSKGLVNDSILTITSYGIDEEVLKNEFKNEDGKYYYYIKVYEDEAKTKLYREEKAEITYSANIEESSETKVELTKYMPDTTYYFEVYAYMLKNNQYKETLLFDAETNNDYVSTVYSFSSLKKDDIIRTNSHKVTTTTEGDVYAKRVLELVVNTKRNIGIYDVRFEIWDNANNLVLERTTTPESKSTSADTSTVIEDITNSDYVFGPGYYTLKIFIETEVLGYEEKQDLLIYEDALNLDKLKDPEIRVGITNGINDLRFNVNIKDDYKVIKDGKYCAVLLDNAGRNIPGIDPICGISALETNKAISFDGLTPDTLYIFRVYADIYTNNNGEVNKNRVIQSRTVLTTSTDYGVALGSVAAYGSTSSVTLSFKSGYNITGIRKIDYTLMETGKDEIASEVYVMDNRLGLGAGEIRKTFQISGSDIRLIIKPDDLNLVKSNSYYIVVNYWVDDPNGSGQLVRLMNKNYSYSIEF